MDINSIMVVVDKPDGKQTAVHRAIDIASSTGAQLLLVGFVYDQAADDRQMLSKDQRKTVRTALMEQERELLQTLKAQAQEAGVRATGRAVWTRALHEWVIANADGHDLVIKSAHRSRRLGHTPTDWHLMRNCPLPVLETIKVRWPKRARVIATLDLGLDSPAQRRLNKRVMQTASSFAAARGAELNVCYCIEVATILKELDIIDKGAYARRKRTQIEPQLTALCADWDLARNRIHTPVGDIEDEINSLADKLKAECIVMGTTARTGLKGLAIGNTAERVLERANTDILTVKP